VDNTASSTWVDPTVLKLNTDTTNVFPFVLTHPATQTAAGVAKASQHCLYIWEAGVTIVDTTFDIADVTAVYDSANNN
jgi:hypothetical protein